MFDRKSDYALNKKDPDAIVCKSVTDVHIGRALSDNTLSLETQLDHPLPSVEEELLEAVDWTAHDVARAALAKQIRSSLTEKQYRRRAYIIWMD